MTPFKRIVRKIANKCRTFLKFSIVNRWVKRRGFVRCPMTVRFWSPHRMVILGDSVQFGPYCSIQCDLTIGSKVLIGPHVAFVGRDDHRYDVVGVPMWDAGRGDNYCTIVEDDVWIGYGAIIVAGVTIGRGSVVGAGSVVVADIPRYSIAVGVPARVVRQRFTETEIEVHERLLGFRGVGG